MTSCGADTAGEDRRTGDSAEALRAELDELYAKRRRGELRDRDFDKVAVRRTIDLYRTAISARLGHGERILAEHHVVCGHFRLNRSVLEETDQGAVSLFATDRRLIRLRSVLAAGAPATCDEKDQTVIDEIQLDQIRGVAVRRQVRVGEAVAGLVIVAIALVFRSWLLITGKLMVGLGALGVVHALLLPTRWVEVQTAGAEPIRILAARRRSARLLVRLLRERLEA